MKKLACILLFVLSALAGFAAVPRVGTNEVATVVQFNSLSNKARAHHNGSQLPDGILNFTDSPTMQWLMTNFGGFNFVVPEVIGGTGGGGGDITYAQHNVTSNHITTNLIGKMNVLSNDLIASLHNFDNVTSNALYVQLVALPTYEAVTNVARFFSTNQVTISSNALFSFIQANRNTNATQATAITALTTATTTASNALQGFIQANRDTNATHATSIAAKQTGSFILSNLLAMGITNIVAGSAGVVLTTNNGVLVITPVAEVTTAQLNTSSNSVLTNLTGRIVTTSNALALALEAKQHGSFLLSNLLAMGISNIVGGANVTITTNSGRLEIASSGGGGGGGGDPVGSNYLHAVKLNKTNDTSYGLTNEGAFTLQNLGSNTATVVSVLGRTAAGKIEEYEIPSSYGILSDDSGNPITSDDDGRSTDAHMGVAVSAYFGVVGGSGVDETANLQAMLDQFTNGTPYHLIIRALHTNDPIRLDSIVTVRGSNLRVEFRSPILLSSNAALVMAGTWGASQSLLDSPDESGGPATTNNWRLTVTNADAYPTGCVVKVSTLETETDITPSALTTGGLRYTNVARMELKRVVEVNGTSDFLVLDTPLVDGPYRPGAPTNATVQIMNVVSNSTFEGLDITWRENGNSLIRAAIHLTNAFRCKVLNSRVNGADGQAIDAIRVEYGLECEVSGCTVENAKAQSSASGYGITVYQSDRTRILNCVSSGNRHNYVLQKANHTEIGFSKSYNESVSGFDIHGVRSFYTHIHDCDAVGGTSYKGSSSNKALYRVGNTSHAAGDFFTLIENCTASFAMPTNGSSSLANYAGVDVHTLSDNVMIRNVTFNNCRTGIRLGNMDQYDTPVFNIVVSGCSFTRVTTPFNVNGTISGSNEIRRLVVENCTDFQGTNHFKFQGVTDLILLNNRVLNVTTTGFRAIDLTKCTNVTAYGNVSIGAAGGWLATTCGNVVTNMNNFQ